MSGRLPADVEAILRAGDLCYLAANGRYGPHLTPTVFALSGDRLWVTTSRASVKARAWAKDPSAAGLIRVGEIAAIFTGTVRSYEVLDLGAWPPMLFEAPSLVRAWVRFTRRNARFFAGYAVDARNVPLSWSPPARVFIGIDLERTAVVGSEGVAETFGDWPREAITVPRFRARPAPRVPVLEALPEDVREPLGEAGHGALALVGEDGLVVLPVSWVVEEGWLYGALAREVLALAGSREARVPAALTIDRASRWRALHMVGAMARGEAEIAVVEELEAGRRSAERIARAAGVAGDAALVRMRPKRLVWWRGFTSGTVTAS
jgi:nitroimidazol reductase NimA-like FMN-containing flavoprotein (pyridoxamine 5'-phosphate oxidase superfamily)